MNNVQKTSFTKLADAKIAVLSLNVITLHSLYLNTREKLINNRNIVDVNIEYSINVDI